MALFRAPRALARRLADLLSESQWNAQQGACCPRGVSSADLVSPPVAAGLFAGAQQSQNVFGSDRSMSAAAESQKVSILT
jgi:hypothetical protein